MHMSGFQKKKICVHMRAPALSQAYVLAVFQTNYYLNKPNPDDVTGFEWWQVQCNLMMLCVCNYACIHVYIIYIYIYIYVRTCVHIHHVLC